MNHPANQPAAKLDMRQHMPETAKWVDAKRKELGAQYVNGCIRRALQGEPGCFYAIERGHVLGTPFPATDVRHNYQGVAIVTGCTFAGFIAEPPMTQGSADGAH